MNKFFSAQLYDD